jgi:HD-GYP domain-containing protein (c-di-GMP phosphodiesterase class II)
MSHTERWLHAFGHALAAHSLYGVGHQARKESSARLLAALNELLRADLRPTFTFLDDTVIYRSLPVHGLREWTWGRRLGAVGVRRLEFTAEVTPDAMDDFLLTLHQRLSGEHASESLPRWPGIEAGDVSVESEPRPVQTRVGAAEPGRVAIGLGEEVDAMRFVCERVAASEPLPVDEISGMVRSLTVALHADGELVMPLLSNSTSDDHLAYHAVNTAVLAMSFSEWLGLGGSDSRAIGRAALLHDIGMVRVPSEVFRVEALSEAGRSGVARHPEDGARLLLRQSPDLELAATTAYEHHLRMDGSGYPSRRFHKEPHYISRVVTLCGAYDALRSERCYRPARDAATALREIEAGRGSAYDPAIAGAFVEMMRKWGGREAVATA